mmetsp:Transcript_102035/g.263786  ORF Transcript_102035/g.263786 Transcript_102035/m.263786 type:complete len:305 (+) Transcript_102035:94-1008(+)
MGKALQRSSLARGLLPDGEEEESCLSTPTVALASFTVGVLFTVIIVATPRMLMEPQQWSRGRASPVRTQLAALEDPLPSNRRLVAELPPLSDATGALSDIAPRDIAPGSRSLRGPGPINLISIAKRYPHIASQSAVWFKGVEEGVSYMAGYVADPSVFTPERKRFWKDLLNQTTVHRIFGPGNLSMHHVYPTDLDIAATVISLNLVVQHGTPIPAWGDKHAHAYAAAIVDVEGRGLVLAVRTEKGMMTDVRSLGEELEYEGIPISNVIFFRQAFKTYVPDIDALSYTVVASWGQVSGPTSLGHA